MTTNENGCGENKPRPNVLYLKRNSLDDGPGIRTTVFMKGCPLSCVWCHNPESKNPAMELMYDAEKCIGCGKCAKKCPQKAISTENKYFIDRDLCAQCFKCATECPSRALEKGGREMAPEEALVEILKDEPFYRNSGGGVTISGGEPALFPEYTGAILKMCRERGIHTLIETSGFFDQQKFMEFIYPHLNQIYFDIKLYDEEDHHEFTGLRNGKILDNFRLLSKLSLEGGTPILPRIPLVPGITATDDNLMAIADFLKECGIDSVALLPYNPTWLRKSVMIGVAPKYEKENWMSREEVDACNAIFKDFKVVV